MKNAIYLFSILLLPILGCNEHPIPDGKYISPDGEEYIIIENSTITFHVKINSEPPTRFLDKKQNYSVSEKDGIISTHTMASSEYAATLAKFNWNWDGKNIIKKSRKDGTTVLFQIRETSPQPAPKDGK